MDIVVNYNNEEFIVELKIWRGSAYETDGMAQLCDYLEAMHADKGYLISFNFNDSVESGIREHDCCGKRILEAVI